MSTAKTETQRDKVDVDSIAAILTFADDEPTQLPPQPKPVATFIPTRNDAKPIACQPSHKTCSAYRESSSDGPSVWLATALRCFSVLFFVVGAGIFVKLYFDSPNTTHTALKPVTTSSSQFGATSRNIEDCELGQRALGKNPVRDQVETLPEPDQETSRKIVLRMRKPSGHRLDIQLIRSMSWIESVGVVEHASFYLNMEEMGAVGDAYVEAILPCPPIQKGDGKRYHRYLRSRS